jgi:hypothetical protein
MSFLGIPVLLYSSQTIFYHPEINYCADTATEYFRAFDVALSDGWRIENIRAACRWYAIDDLYSRIDLSDSYSYREYQEVPIYKRVARRFARALQPGFDQIRDCRRRSPQLAMGDIAARVIETGAESLLDLLDPGQLPVSTLEIEERAIRREFKRLCTALYGSKFTTPGGKLKRNLLKLVA